MKPIILSSSIQLLKASVRRLPVLAVVTIGLGIGVLSAQTPRQPSVTAQPDAPDQAPVFRAGVTLVTTDVIVRDRDGLFVADLTPEDFTILEDGQPQEVVSLVLVHGGRVYNQLSPPQPTREGIILPATRPRNDTAGRIIVLFVDDLHLETSQTPKIRAVFRTIAETLIHEGDLFGVISTGPSSLSIDLNYDRSLLRAAEDRIMGDGFNMRELVENLQSGPQGPTELRYRAHVAFKTAHQVVENLAEVRDRRKVFIYLSSGYDLNPFAVERLFGRSQAASALRQGQQSLFQRDITQDQFDSQYGDYVDPLIDPYERQVRQGSVFADTDLVVFMTELTQVANRANVSFYTIDPRGLVAGPGAENQQVNISEWNEYIFQTQNSLRFLAELTGGIAVVGTNNFKNFLQRIDAETSDYYVVGFNTSNPDPTDRTRQLRVDVDREGVELRYRTSYTFARPTDGAQ